MLRLKATGVSSQSNGTDSSLPTENDVALNRGSMTLRYICFVSRIVCKHRRDQIVMNFTDDYYDYCTPHNMKVEAASADSQSSWNDSSMIGRRD